MFPKILQACSTNSSSHGSHAVADWLAAVTFVCAGGASSNNKKTALSAFPPFTPSSSSPSTINDNNDSKAHNVLNLSLIQSSMENLLLPLLTSNSTSSHLAETCNVLYCIYYLVYDSAKAASSSLSPSSTPIASWMSSHVLPYLLAYYQQQAVTIATIEAVEIIFRTFMTQTQSLPKQYECVFVLLCLSLLTMS